MQTQNLTVPNAIIFVLDVTAKDIVIPEYVPSELIAYNNHCLSIGTQTEEDGEVNITLARKNETSCEGLEKIHDIDLYIQNKKLSIVTATLQTIMGENLSHSHVYLSIYVNEKDYPSRVLIEYEEIE